ncbi:hypothetical protein EMEDMD4_280088 [Sinorhizobium medicae]|uniref:Uncharacterized protein n=1 Tax=Sinorhizobium medicae TaxID=110321 RepID=A0A508X165_9HYPH|nr:hypothetical protein EMEDMD4_280088 [Sinorhizobium medicae]
MEHATGNPGADDGTHRQAELDLV